jgi:hypothetical protein
MSSRVNAVCKCSLRFSRAMADCERILRAVGSGWSIAAFTSGRVAEVAASVDAHHEQAVLRAVERTDIVCVASMSTQVCVFFLYDYACMAILDATTVAYVPANDRPPAAQSNEHVVQLAGTLRVSEEAVPLTVSLRLPYESGANFVDQLAAQLGFSVPEPPREHVGSLSAALVDAFSAAAGIGDWAPAPPAPIEPVPVPAQPPPVIPALIQPQPAPVVQQVAQPVPVQQTPARRQLPVSALYPQLRRAPAPASNVPRVESAQTPLSTKPIKDNPAAQFWLGQVQPLPPSNNGALRGKKETGPLRRHDGAASADNPAQDAPVSSTQARANPEPVPSHGSAIFGAASAQPVSPHSQRNSTQEQVRRGPCAICADDDVPLVDHPGVAYTHASCWQCMSRHVMAKIDEGITDIPCIEPGCTISSLGYTQVKAILCSKHLAGDAQLQQDARASWARFELLKRKKELDGVKDLIWCSHCGDAQSHSDRDALRPFRCRVPSCGGLTCSVHGVPYRERRKLLAQNGVVVDAVEGQPAFCCAMGEEDHRFATASYAPTFSESGEMVWPEGCPGPTIKKCPHCGQGIEKNEGCRHMTCASCRFEFFWCCLRAYRDESQAREHRQRCG